MIDKLRAGLFGTCNHSNWRNSLKNLLKKEYIDIFDPISEVWNSSTIENENHEKEIDDYVVFVITPEMTGVYSIAEVTDLSNKRPKNTLLCILSEYGDKVFDSSQRKSLNAVYNLVKNNGTRCFDSLEEIALFLNRTAMALNSISR